MSAPSVSDTFCGAMTLPLDLRHLVALAVDDEAVRQQRLVRRAAVDGAAGEQRGLEPAAMLVGAFEVQVGRIGQVRRHASRAARASAWCRNRTRRRACRFILSYWAASAPSSSAASRLNQASMPCLLDALGDLLDQFRRCAGAAAPVSLCRKNGIGTPQLRWRETHQSGRVLHHRFQAGAAPGREELRFVDGALGDPAQGRGVLRPSCAPCR